MSAVLGASLITGYSERQPYQGFCGPDFTVVCGLPELLCAKTAVHIVGRSLHKVFLL